MNYSTAVNLAQQGFSIFPCYAGGERIKTPIAGIRWREESTNNIEQIKKWWQMYPFVIPAIDVGKSGFVVIDADRHQEDQDGVSALFELFNYYQYDPSGIPFVFTPSNGLHYYFRQPEGKNLTNKTGSLPKGVDVRGVGGYVLAPNTILQDGRQYISNMDLRYAPVIPDWLVNIIEKSAEQQPTHLFSKVEYKNDNQKENIYKYIKKALENECNTVLNASQGDRNNTLNISAFSLGTLVGTGELSYSDAETWLFNSAMSIGLNQIEAKKTINSGLKSGMKSPRDLSLVVNSTNQYNENVIYVEEEPEFEVEPEQPSRSGVPVIPYPAGVVGELAKWITDTALYPQPNLSIGAALIIVATLTGRQYMTPDDGATSLYVINIAGTSQGKNHPHTIVDDVLNQLDLNNLIGADNFLSESSIVNIIENNPISVSTLDEFGDFLAKILSSRCSPYEKAIAPLLRVLWSIGFKNYKTPAKAQSKPVHIPAPAFNLLGSTTPLQFYRSLKEGALESGTLNRFLVFAPHGFVESNPNRIRNSKLPTDLREKLRSIYLAQGTLVLSSRECSKSIPPLTPITWEDNLAYEAFEAFRKETQLAIRDDERRGYFTGRSVEMCLRIATIIAIGDNRRSVSVNDINTARNIVSISIDIMENGAKEFMAENLTEEQRNKVFYAIKKRPVHGIDHSLLLRSIRGLKGKEINDILKTLIDSEEIICTVIESPGRKTKRVYTINNKLLKK